MTPGLFDSSYAKSLIDNKHCISFNRLDESIDNSGIERISYVALRMVGLVMPHLTVGLCRLLDFLI